MPAVTLLRGATLGENPDPSSPLPNHTDRLPEMCVQPALLAVRPNFPHQSARTRARRLDGHARQVLRYELAWHFLAQSMPSVQQQVYSILPSGDVCRCQTHLC